MVSDSPILVTGIPRSGSSMIAGVLHHCGAFTGNVSLHKGSFENGALQRFVENAYLESIKKDIMGQYPLPDKIEDIPTYWGKIISTQLLAEGYIKGAWLYKSARIGLLWRIWNQTYPNAKWVLVRRRTGDIVDSCLKTGYMTAFKDSKIMSEIGVDNEKDGWLWWVHEYEKRFVEMLTEGINCKVIWPERFVDGDYRQLYELLDWVGLTWKSSVLNFIDPLLESSRSKGRR